MSLVTAVLAGAAVAVRHSFEPDHLAAVSTLVECDGERPASVGASWGLGHSLVILLAGLAFLAMGIRYPEPVGLGFEALAGLILVYLGWRTLTRLLEPRAAYSHRHAGHRHNHVSFAGLDLGYTHTHLHDGSVLVGAVHGFAGSGALVLLLASTASTPLQGAVYLAVFSVTTVAAMAAASHLWSKLLDTDLDRYIRGAAGTASLVVGVLIVAETLSLL